MKNKSKKKIKIYEAIAVKDFSLDNPLLNESWKQGNIYTVQEDKYISSISNESGLYSQFDKVTWTVLKNNFITA